MRPDEVKPKFERLMADRGVPYAGMTHDAYLQAAVEVMLEIIAEVVAELNAKGRTT